MTDRPIEPESVVLLVEHFVDQTLADVAKYENTQPLDSSNVYSLHELAAEVYALGFDAGRRSQAERDRRDRARSRA